MLVGFFLLVGGQQCYLLVMKVRTLFISLFMVPMPNHYEQFANCTDAYLHNFAVFSDTIDLDKIPTNQTGNTQWFDKYKEILSSVTYQHIS
jgi:hypothetical protein